MWRTASDLAWLEPGRGVQGNRDGNRRCSINLKLAIPTALVSGSFVIGKHRVNSGNQGGSVKSARRVILVSQAVTPQIFV